MTRRSARRHGHHVRDLLGRLNRKVAPAAFDDSRTSAFVDCKLYIEKIPMVVDKPSHSERPARLFIGCRKKHDVARECDPAIDNLPLEREHGHEIGGQHSLVVDGTTAVQISIPHDTAERVARPFVALDSDNIHMREQHHAALRSIPFQSSSHGSPLGRRDEETGLDARQLQRSGDMPGKRKLVARRIGGVEPDHRLKLGDRLRLYDGPVNSQAASRYF